MNVCCRDCGISRDEADERIDPTGDGEWVCTYTCEPPGDNDGD